MKEQKKKHFRYWVYFLITAGFFCWIGTLCGAGLAHHSLEKQSEKYRVEMVKDSLYQEFIKRHDKE